MGSILNKDVRIAIYGAGSLGSVLGAYLSDLNVELFTHNKNHVRAMNENGIKVIGKCEFVKRVKAYLPEEMNGLYDVIFLLTKQQNNKEVVMFLKNHLKEDGVLVTGQNGIPEIEISKLIGDEKVLGMSVGWGAELISSGIVRVTTPPETFIFSLGSPTQIISSKTGLVKEILEKMGKVELNSNFIGARFAKLLVNASFTGLSAICNDCFGYVAKNKETRKYVQLLMKECIEVAKANNIKIEKIQGNDIVKIFDYNNSIKKWISYFFIPIAMKKHYATRSSVLQDLEKGKLSEIDSINGLIVSLGENKNIPTPYNQKVIEIIHKIENKELPLSKDNVKELRSI